MKITQDQLDVIATYMNDEIREDVHNRVAPCDPDVFLNQYLKLDPAFEEILLSEFHIEWEECEE